MDELRTLLRDAEDAQHQTLQAATNDLQHIPRLEDPVLLLLDVLCQLETKESRQEALQVVRRLLALCSEHIYAFEESCEDATKSPKISSRNIIVLKTLIDTIKTLSSRDNGDDESVQTLIDITQEMCAQSMNAVYMATLFNFMRLSQSPARRLVLQMQKRLVEMDPLPRAVFSTKGSTAGLLVPSDEQLFTKKGYSCSFGIRLDANAIDAALYSFCGQNGQGVSASLRNNILILKMVARQGCVQQVEVPFSNYVTTMKKEWVHLCIVHAKKMVFKDKVTVYVNGINVFDGNLGYPDPLTMLGGKFSIGLERLVDGLNGKLWRPTLFGVALSAAEVQTLHWRTHWKNDLYAVAAGQPDESKMCFCYDARSCDLKKRICYDVSGKDNHGSLEPGTSVSVTQSFAHALESFGGCACFLLPLLDRIPEAADFHPVHEFETMEIADLFAFVGAGLSSSSACCSHFVRLEGVNIVGYILQSISPSDLSLSVLKGLVSIVEAVINFLESDDRIIEYINCLLFLNTNWFYSPFETQVKLLGEVLPTFLQILQAATLRERNCLVGTRPSSSSRGKLVFSRAPSLSESWSINNQVDVSFFCWLLSHVYVVQASSEKDKFATVQMSSQQFAQLHELLLQKLIDPLLFPSVQDAATDQWRQLMGFLFQQCEIRSTKGSCDRDSRSIEKLIQYVTKNIALAEPCKATADLLARQLQVTTNIQNLSKGSVRLFWTLMSSANYNVRLAALQLFEMYTTTENVVLNKSDMLMLYWSFQGHPLTDDLADLLLDIVIGRKPLSQGNEKESADVRMGNFARMSFIPIVLLGLIHNANLKVQASILAEIRVQMASPTMGENVKEVVRSWPSLLSRLRSLALEAVAVSSSIEKQREASFVNSETLNKASSILSDNLVSSSEKVEVLQAIADYREVCGCDFALSLLQGRNQSEAVTRAITTMVIEHFPHRSPELICILVNHMIIDTIVYCILHVRNGWMHFLEFYFYHCQFPRDLVSLTAVICEQVIEQTSPTSSKVQIGIVWENVCQVAAVISQSSLVATKMVEDLKLNDVILSPSQQTILTRSACKLWQFVLPHWDRMNWDAMAATLLETSDYGSDVTSEETYIFTHLVANCTRAVFLALQTTIQDVKESQSSSKNDDKLAQKFHDILKLSALIDTLQFGLENSEKATVHMYTLDSCLTFLEASLETNDIECVELLVKVIVALANTAESFYDFSSRPALLKTLQIMSSTDLSFFKELSQFRELVMLWIYCRQNHHACCDSELFNTVSHQLHAEFIANWIYVMKHNTLDFNPYLVQQDASSQAELLGAEIQQCEDLWNDIVDVSEAPDVGRVREQEILDESRIVEVKRSAAKLATSVRKLLARSSHDEPDSSPVFREDGTAENQVKSRKPTDGRVWKIDTRENNLRMRLRMKRVSQDARARNLSYEYRTSSLSDTESKSGNQLCRQFRVPTENNLVDLEHSWRSDGGSDYSDFLADTQMRSVIIQSLSNPEAHETADGKGSDDDEFEEIDDPFQRKRRWEQNSTEHDGDAHSHLKNSSSGHVQAISSAQDCADRTEIAVRKEGAMVTSESSFVRSPMASPPRSGFSLGASVLTVVGGMADFFQKSVQDAKDALESNIDSLYTTKDAISEDSQALMQGMSFYTPRNYVLPVESVRSDNCTEEPTCNLMKERKHGTEKSESVSESSLPSPTTRLSREGEDAPTKFDLQLDAQLMRHMHVVQGKLIVTRSSVHFVAERVVDESEAALVEKKSGIPVDQAWPFLLKRRRWKIDDIASLYRRRYFLKPTALELFIFSTRKNYFFNLTSGNVVLFYKTLMARKPLLLKRDPNVRRLRHPSTLFCNSQCTIRWIQHEISTFEYLMWLNTIAGRTYNDLTQYPVFPWILADYESTTLDLGRRAAYRDLTKPMGALEPTRLKFYVDRYNTFEDTDIPKFMYGTHYSNIGAVLYYLIRLEPFTSYAQSLQGGKFDHSDRLFHSIAETWHHCLTDYSDLKELTPEWFYLPDFLVNRNGLELGTRQNGTTVNDVVLPPWARSPEDFVMKNFVALESEYVSANIHHWIDLIFGCKQRGTAAVEANNVFFYLTYEGMVDIDSITDPIVKSSMQSQIAHFGQTPTQVLREPHPQRCPLESVMVARNPATPLLSFVDDTHALVHVPHEAPIGLISILSSTSQLVCLDRNGMFSSHRFGRRVSRPRQDNHMVNTSKGTSTCSESFSRDQANQVLFEVEDHKSRKVFGDERLLTTQSRLSSIMTLLDSGMTLCTVGHHDFSARFYSTTDGTLRYRLQQHQSVVTSVSTTNMGTLLALGCADGTISVWKVASMNATLLPSLTIFRGAKARSKLVHANDYSADQVLLGHNAQINCVSLSDELGICVSGSASNECLVHNLEDGSIFHSYNVPGHLEPGILLLALSSVGHVVLQSMGTGSPMLYSFHMNGSLLAQVSLGSHSMTSLSICARYAKVLVSNYEQALVMSAHSLDDRRVLLDHAMYGDISAQSLTPDETHAVFGVGTGKIVAVPLFAFQTRSYQTEM